MMVYIHWNEDVAILMKFSSLAALKVVKMTTFSATSDENFIKMTTFPFQWSNGIVDIPDYHYVFIVVYSSYRWGYVYMGT